MDKEQEKRFALHHMDKYGLIPCPFCGGLPFLERNQRAFVGGKPAIVTYVRCVNCNARGGRENVADYGKTSSSSQATNKAIEKWNRRADNEW